jgi:hypothetical protein
MLQQARSADGRQVLHLLLGQVEPDPVLDLSHRAGRDGDFPASPQMPFPEQHVGHPVVARIDLAAVYTDGSGGSPLVAAVLCVSIGLFLMLISASC